MRNLLYVYPPYPRPPRGDTKARKMIADALRLWRREVRERWAAERVRIQPRRESGGDSQPKKCSYGEAESDSAIIGQMAYAEKRGIRLISAGSDNGCFVGLADLDSRARLSSDESVSAIVGQTAYRDFTLFLEEKPASDNGRDVALADLDSPAGVVLRPALSSTKFPAGRQ